jgi:hypothetical protein
MMRRNGRIQHILLFFQIKEETSDEDSDTLSMSLNVDFDKLDRKKFNSKEFVFVTEDGKTAECFEEIGKNIRIDSVYVHKRKQG